MNNRYELTLVRELTGGRRVIVEPVTRSVHLRTADGRTSSRLGQFEENTASTGFDFTPDPEAAPPTGDEVEVIVSCLQQLWALEQDADFELNLPPAVPAEYPVPVLETLRVRQRKNKTDTDTLLLEVMLREPAMFQYEVNRTTGKVRLNQTFDDQADDMLIDQELDEIRTFLRHCPHRAAELIEVEEVPPPFSLEHVQLAMTKQSDHSFDLTLVVQGRKLALVSVPQDPAVPVKLTRMPLSTASKHVMLNDAVLQEILRVYSWLDRTRQPWPNLIPNHEHSESC